MGLTFIDIVIANPANPRKAKKLSLLVDSGAIYSVVSKEVLRQLGVKPHSTKTFTLADGSAISRKIGDAIFKLNGHQGASPVIFGEKGDSALLGTVSLEALGLLLDPLRRELRPLPMVLGSHNPPPSRRGKRGQVIFIAPRRQARKERPIRISPNLGILCASHSFSDVFDLKFEPKFQISLART